MTMTKQNRQMTTKGSYVIIHYAGKHHDIPVEDHSQRPIVEAILEDFWKKISTPIQPEPKAEAEAKAEP